jgi:hypothetical protein
MHDWNQPVTDWLNAVAEQAETVLFDWSEEVASNLEHLANAAEQAEETMVEHLDKAISPWLEQYVQPLLDVSPEWDIELEHTIEAVVQPWRQTIEPSLNQHPICTGCQHYHGTAYGDQMLVCGMHPYGPSADQTECLDKAPIDWQEPWKTWFQATWPAEH